MQKVCTVDPEAPTCEHERFVEVWGDTGGTEASLLGRHEGDIELGTMYDSDLIVLADACWKYNERLHTAAQSGPLNECEQYHRQRFALDMVRLLVELRRRSIVF